MEIKRVPHVKLLLIDNGVLLQNCVHPVIEPIKFFVNVADATEAARLLLKGAQGPITEIDSSSDDLRGLTP